MTFIPLLPYEQNRLLFGDQKTEPTPIHLMAELLVRDELEGLLGNPINHPDFLPTTTQLPDFGGIGPRAAMDQAIDQYYGERLSGMEALLTCPPVDTIPPAQIIPGWTFYPYSGGAETVPHPQEDTFYLDTETYVVGGGHPLIGIALSLKGWYVWLHPQICKEWTPQRFDPCLIPLGPGKTFVAHNALFDLSKTVEAYSLGNQDRPMAFCTMAMHGTISAMGGEQVKRAFMSIPKNAPLPWMKEICGDSLQDCLKFYTGMTINKEARGLFVKGKLPEIIAALPELLKYALTDVSALSWLGFAIWPLFKLQCPSKATTVGLLELSHSLLTVDHTYDNRVWLNDNRLAMKQRELVADLWKLCQKLNQYFLSGKLDISDPWLSQLDWTPAKTGKNKGVPAWYRKILSSKGGLTLGMACVPLIMRMTWKGQPLKFDPSKKWGWVNPESEKWERLPHPDGKGKNVGSPLSKHFGQFIESGILAGDTETNLPAEISKLSYWVSYQSRFAEEYKMPVDAPNRLGIVPVTRLIGTLTGRQVHKTWLTAAQCKVGKLGSDFYHVIQPPEGWYNVLWDEDTEEVRIAALWGDFNRGLGLGCTAMSQIAFMGVNTGNLETATDAHSVTARLAYITRDEGKTANFRDIFGGGRVTQANAIQSVHPDWSEAQVNGVVTKIIDAKRGTKINGKYDGGTDSFYHNQASMIADTPDFRLPMTGRMMPKVINPNYDQTGMFYTSRYNFPVQGTGADILHLTAVAVPILCIQRGIPADCYGYVMARHDEIAYNVKAGYELQFAEIANAAHCWAWAVLLEALGFNWMPTSLARLTGINIDKVYRKDVKKSTEAGYGAGWTFDNGTEVA